MTSPQVVTMWGRCSRLPLRIAVVGFLGAGLAGCLGYDGEINHGYQLDPQAASDVKPGQTAEQVLVTLGSPSTTSTVGGDAWYYISQKTERAVAFMQPSVTERRVYAVYFDKGKKVSHIANYGLKDGRVIDFASGTTPTFGGDNGFLKSLFFNVNPLGAFMPKS